MKQAQRACAGTTAQVREIVRQSRELKLKVEANFSDGTVKVIDGDITIYRALQMGRGGNWMVMLKDGPTVTWPDPEELTPAGAVQGTTPTDGGTVG